MLEAGETVYSYVAIRADEEYREGYSSKQERVVVRLPLKESGIDKVGVLEILDGAGLGFPADNEWRTRSGCTFCFFQQKIEWVRLVERHPQFLEEACRYEKTALVGGSPFTWSQGQSLEQLAEPKRIAEIERDHEQRDQRLQTRVQVNPLRPDCEPLDIHDLYGQAKVCIARHK